MKKIFLTLALFITSFCFAQLENANWCFKNQAGVNFNSTPNPTAANCSFTAVMPGINAASVSDKNGSLLFYTNGIKVWDKNHNEMPNGNGLYGGTEPTYDQQGLIIVPKPNSDRLYYIFSVTSSPSPSTSYHTGFFYSVVDMDPSVNGGNGDVIGVKNIPLNNHNSIPIDYDFINHTGQLQIVDNSLTSTLNEHGDGIWVSLFAGFIEGGVMQRRAYQYLITTNGINDGANLDPTTNFALDNTNYPNGLGASFGHSKFSPPGNPTGNFLCNANGTGVTLYNFNPQTGIIQIPGNNIFTSSGGSGSGFGLEFSPQGNLIYFSCTDNIIQQNKNQIISSSNQGKIIRIRQYNINTPDSTPIIIGSIELKNTDALHSSIIPLPVNYRPFNIQRGINNILYVAQNPNTANGGQYLGAITDPNTPGTGCIFVNNALQLNPNTGVYGNLPQWVYKTKSSIWPKVYASNKGPDYLGKDNNGNLFMRLNVVYPSTNLNHNGSLPSPPYGGQYFFHYLSSNGITNWTKRSIIPHFSLINGDIQLYDYSNYAYHNGTSGNVSTPPLLVPGPEIILAETNTGQYITKAVLSNGYYTLYVHSSIYGTTSVNAGRVDQTKFNPTTNTFFTVETLPSFQLKVYSLQSGTLNQIASCPLPGTLVPVIVQIDNQDKVYLMVNNTLQNLDYFTNTYSPVIISGFTNSNIGMILSSNPYTEDRCLLSQTAEQKIYALDFSNLTQKKIQTSSTYASNCYVFDGNEVYIAGKISGVGVDIGSQHIPVLTTPQSNYSIFLAKFNLLTDFSSLTGFNSTKSEEVKTPSLQNTNSFSIRLSPNPASRLLIIEINEKEKLTGSSSYTISIFDHTGSVWLKKKKYISGSSLDISSLKTGIYSVEIMNTKGEKLAKNIVKL